MKKAVHIHHVLMANSHVSTADVFHNHKFVMELMTVRIMQHPMKLTNDAHKTPLARQIISNVRKLTSVSNHIGFVMEIMTVVTIQVRIMQRKFSHHSGSTI